MGFTLAEVLITLAIIGVVAVLTMPTLIANIQDKVFETQRKAATSKLSQAISIMYTDGKLEQSANVDEFVENLKSYLKIVKVCEKSDLDACFTYPEGKLSQEQNQNQQLLLQNILTQPAYAVNNTHAISLAPIYNSYVSTEDLKGIITADGTSMVIGYAKGCSSILPSVKGIHGEDMSMSPASTDTTVMPISKDERACVVAMVDVNNNKKPNTIDKDIFYYQAGFSKHNILQQGGQSMLDGNPDYQK